jgi:hypothetical protein
LYKRTTIAGTVLGCCLLAAATGCSFHRTEHGFILRSGQWTLERNSQPLDAAAAPASEKPELLPWRNRLRGYRFGSRIFHGRDSADTVAMPSTAPDDSRPSEAKPTDLPSNRPDLVID